MELKNAWEQRRKGEPDLGFLIAVVILTGTGIAMIYSASAVNAQKIFGDSFYFLKKQGLWFIIGSIVLLMAQQIDYRHYLNKTRIMLTLSFIFLVLVLVPGIGHNVKGSSRWLGLGPLAFQPSEFVKIAVVIYIAKMFSSDKRDGHVGRLLVPLIMVALFFILIMLQPDFGTAMDLLLVSVILLFISGFSMLYIMSLFIISIPMFYLLIYQVDYRRERILAYLNPWADRYGIGYHIIQSFIAFRKGGILGMGLGNGTQKVSRLPEPHTDFIFAVVAEEAGVAGTVLLLVLFLALFAKGVEISLKAPDQFGMLLGIGLSLLLMIQAMINMGVVCGIIPTTGIPLPFVSYGGSSLLSSMAASGIILNISRYGGMGGKAFKPAGEAWQ